MPPEPIFDTHVHVWSSDHGSFPPRPVPGQVFQDKVNAEAAELIRLMDENGVARTVIVAAAAFTHDNRYLLKVLDDYPDRFVGMGALPVIPTAEEITNGLDLLDDGRITGIRIFLNREPALGLFAAGAFDAVLRTATERRLLVSVLCRTPAGPAAVDAIAARFPDLALIVDHFCYATTKFGAGEPERRALLDLSRHRNIHAKLAIHYQISSEPYPWRDLHPLQLAMIEAFGPERLMWGSNFPMFVPHPPYEDRLTALTRHFPFPTLESRDWILWKTAEKLWPAAKSIGHEAQVR